MDTHREIFGDWSATVRTVLSGPAWKHLQKRAASLCRFAARVLEELRPGGIGNALVERSISVDLHIGNVQIFTDEDLIGVDESPAGFVGKVGPAVGDPLVYMLHHTPGFLACGRAFCLCTELALRFLQRFGITTEETRVVNAGAIAKRSKGRQPHI